MRLCGRKIADGEPLFFIAGPCVIESRDHALWCAEQIEAISRRDYPVLQGGTLLLGVVVMSVNLFVDLLYGLINPRIRHAK